METLVRLKQQLAEPHLFEVYDIRATVETLLPEQLSQLEASELNAYLKHALSAERYILWCELVSIVVSCPYSQSYSRRSYRAPNNAKKHAQLLTTVLLELFSERSLHVLDVFAAQGKADFVSGRFYFVNEAKQPLMAQDVFPLMLAYELNQHHVEVEQIVRDVLWKNGAHPLYSKYFIKGIFMSQRSELYKLVGDVLLAAKNQEGARQVIVETIDEGTLEAQYYFMTLIVEHNLLRFSSIVRAVDVWFGVGYDVKNKKEIHYLLTESVMALANARYTRELLQSKSSLAVLVGMWVVATQNIEELLLMLDELMQRESHIQQTVLYVLQQAQLEKLGALVYPYLLKTNELHTFLAGFSLVVDYIPGRFYNFDEDLKELLLQSYFDERPWLLTYADDWLKQLAQFEQQLRGDVYKVEGQPFPFLQLVFQKETFYELRVLLLCMQQRVDIVAQLASDVPNWPVRARSYFYFASSQLLGQHDYLLQALQDRSIDIRKEALQLLAQVNYPLSKFQHVMPKLLTLKTGEIRQAVIQLLSIQPIAELVRFAKEQLKSPKEAVRLGILEVLVTVQQQLTEDFTQLIVHPTEKEQQLLSQFTTQQTFVTMPLPELQVLQTQVHETVFTFQQLIHYDFSALKEKLASLVQLMMQYQHVSYVVEHWGEEHHVLIGEQLRSVQQTEKITAIDELPLSDIWTNWLVNSPLTDEEVCVFLYMYQLQRSYFMNFLTAKGERFIRDYFGTCHPEELLAIFQDFPFYEQVATILKYTLQRTTAPLQNELNARFMTVDYVSFCASMLRDLYATVPMEEDLINSFTNDRSKTIDIPLFKLAFEEMANYATTAVQFYELVTVTALFYEDVEQFQYVTPEGLLQLFDAQVIDERHVRRLLITDYFSSLLSRQSTSLKNRTSFPILQKLIREVNAFIVEQELVRGELETAVTRYVKDVDAICADKYFVSLLKALDGEKLSRQSLYYVRTRKESLSLLLQKLTVKDINEQAFFQQLDEARFEPKRLIEVMLYNTELIAILSRYIGWTGLAQVAWYFVAHTAEHATDFEKAKISEYSAMAPEDFMRGAFDRAWFIEASQQMTSQQFNIVYEAAKYSTSGANHRRAQLYAKAALGELDDTLLRKEIEQKRNLDKLRAYSLLPTTLEQAKERYLFLQQFLQQSKQFGAQRQASEALAVEMAIQNLALQVAKGNTPQFIWQMEYERFLQLEQYFSPQVIDDITLLLVQNEQGTIMLHVNKGEKALKSVPKKLAKHELVLVMQQARKELTEQSKRARLQLERAMCEETNFDCTTIERLATTQLFAPLLCQLVWQQGNEFYYLQSGLFKTLTDDALLLSNTVQLAHPYHLHKANVWREWQQFAFTKQWQQPFKQLFRELYLVTEDELEKTSTNRFEGYQIQPNKAIALLKGRGWTTGYYEPIRKISYYYNMIAVMDFQYTAFTASEVEEPTLHNVTFINRFTYEQQHLKQVPAIYFSEVMRDVDLVVSVAHVGEVDPEASHSTMEVRAVIIEEIVQLLQLPHVQLTKTHAIIEGKLGDYSIHLGSGTVHQLGGAQIPVSAVPSQHRGRVFLPFVDEDPKTAEIVAKVLLFADDRNIVDPIIRKAIQ